MKDRRMEMLKQKIEDTRAARARIEGREKAARQYIVQREHEIAGWRERMEDRLLEQANLKHAHVHTSMHICMHARTHMLVVVGAVAASELWVLSSIVYVLLLCVTWPVVWSMF